jgi:hypothetical protein
VAFVFNLFFPKSSQADIGIPRRFLLLIILFRQTGNLTEVKKKYPNPLPKKLSKFDVVPTKWEKVWKIAVKILSIFQSNSFSS